MCGRRRKRLGEEVYVLTTAYNINCIDGVTFESIYDAYCFDVELRALLRTYLETAEVYYKSQIGYWFAIKKCLLPPHDQHYDRGNYFNKQGFDAIMSGFQKRGANYYQDSLIMKHHQAKYKGKLQSEIPALTIMLIFFY